jgi:hypothetical protein
MHRPWACTRLCAWVWGEASSRRDLCLPPSAVVGCSRQERARHLSRGPHTACSAHLNASLNVVFQRLHLFSHESQFNGSFHCRGRESGGEVGLTGSCGGVRQSTCS